MIKKALILLLIISVFSNAVMQLVMYTSYQINKEYISSVFCENRAHPELHCEGKCFLHKKLKDLDSKSKQEQENVLKVLTFTTDFTYITLPKNTDSFEIKNQIGYLNKAYKSRIISIFHPPKIA